MFNKKKKIIEQLKLEKDAVLNLLYKEKASLLNLNISYNLLEEKYKIVCKERDEYKAKLDQIKEGNRERQSRYYKRKTSKKEK